MIRKLLILGILAMMSNINYAQTFSEYLAELPTIPCPRKFKSDTLVNFANLNLPSHLFSGSEFNLTKQKALARLELDNSYPIILIGTASDQGYINLISAYTFDLNGNYISRKLIWHDLVGEGSTYSITPENKIRIASYGASDAVINTYRYENGQFIREGEREYADADNLPEY